MKKPFSLILGALMMLGSGCPKEPTKTSAPPFKISMKEKIERVEITKPKGEKIVLEKKGRWTIVEPLEAKLAETYENKLNTMFGQDISMDGALSEKLDRYDLSDGSAYKVALFTKGGSKAASEFFVGKESSTGKEQRSYIKTMNGKAFVAKSDIASVVRASLDNLRSHVVFHSVKEPNSIEIQNRKDGHVKFEKKASKWEMTLPQKEAFHIAPLEVKQLIETFTHLNAAGFSGRKTDKEMDLDPPLSTVVAMFGKDKVEYEIGNPAKKIYYLREKGSKLAYRITKGPGRVLAGDYLIFKHRVEKTIPLKDIKSFQLAGKESLIIKKKGKRWFAGKAALDGSKIAPLLGSFAKMTAISWKEKSIEDAGLGKKSAGKITLKTDDKTYVFEIGSVFKKDGSRYARWADSDYVMEIPKYIWERATTGLDALKAPKNKG